MEMGFQGYVSEIQSGKKKSMSVDALRKGPWTDEEDDLLFSYVNLYGDGRWNSVAFNTGLKRTGKSCRLRWMNYLRPDLRRGNITLEEQLLILILHCRWGNRWSKIARHISGRTDNEIKNYWRTRVQKQAKHLKCDANSQQFQDMLRDVFIPRIMEKIIASKASVGGVSSESWDTHVSPISGITESAYSGVSGYQCIENSHNLFGETGTCPELLAPGGYLDTTPAQPGSGVQFFDENINKHRSDGGDDQSFDIEAWNQESLMLLRQQLFEEDLWMKSGHVN